MRQPTPFELRNIVNPVTGNIDLALCDSIGRVVDITDHDNLIAIRDAFSQAARAEADAIEKEDMEEKMEAMQEEIESKEKELARLEKDIEVLKSTSQNIKAQASEIAKNTMTLAGVTETLNLAIKNII